MDHVNDDPFLFVSFQLFISSSSGTIQMKIIKILFVSCRTNFILDPIFYKMLLIYSNNGKGNKKILWSTQDLNLNIHIDNLTY